MTPIYLEVILPKETVCCHELHPGPLRVDVIVAEDNEGLLALGHAPHDLIRDGLPQLPVDRVDADLEAGLLEPGVEDPLRELGVLVTVGDEDIEHGVLWGLRTSEFAHQAEKYQQNEDHYNSSKVKLKLVMANNDDEVRIENTEGSIRALVVTVVSDYDVFQHISSGACAHPRSV